MSAFYLITRIAVQNLPNLRSFPHPGLLTGILLGFVILLSAQHFVVAQTTAENTSSEATSADTSSPLKNQTTIADSVSATTDDHDLANRTQYRGQVVDADGNPAANCIVSVTYWSPSCGQRQTKSTTTDGNGNFRILFELLPSEWYSTPRIQATNSTRTQMAYYRFPEEEAELADLHIKMRLSPTKAVRLKAVDAKGDPIVDAHAGIELEHPHTLSGIMTDESGIAQFEIPETEHVKAFVAWKDDLGMGYRSRDWQTRLSLGSSFVASEPGDGIDETVTLKKANRVAVTVVDEDQNPIPGIPVYPTRLGLGGWLSGDTSVYLGSFLECFVEHTDERGVATFAWIPTWAKKSIEFYPFSMDHSSYGGKYDPKSNTDAFTIVLRKKVPVRGQVLDAEGSPVQGIQVHAQGAGVSHRGQQNRMWIHHEFTITDEQGAYELRVPPNNTYLVTAYKNEWASAPHAGLAARGNQPIEERNFTLRPATRVFGKFIHGRTQQPMANQCLAFRQYGQDISRLEGEQLPNPDNMQINGPPIVESYLYTNQEGEFEIYLGDGSFTLSSSDQFEMKKFEISGEEEIELQLKTPGR